MVTFKFDLDGDNPEEIAQIMVQLSHFETLLMPFHQVKKEENSEKFKLHCFAQYCLFKSKVNENYTYLCFGCCLSFLIYVGCLMMCILVLG